MATCPFCTATLEMVEGHWLEDAAGISEGAALGDLVCPAGGSRFRRALVPRYPVHVEHWYLLVGDHRICLRTAREPTEAEQRFLWCLFCTSDAAVPVCPGPHPSRHRPRDHGEQPLEVVRDLERLEVEGVTVDVEVTRFRCAIHGELHDRAHRVIRREPGP